MSTLPRRTLLCAFCVCWGVIGVAQNLRSSDTIRIGVLHNGSYDVVTLPLETYVARVLTGEALPGSEPAAYEALAIAIRTYALGNRGRHRADGFDLCDQTHCQVMRASSLVTERAALATAGQVLLFGGAPATVYYSASCGGRTEKPSNVWPGAEDVPYLPSRPDDGCGGMPVWSTELSTGDLQRALQAAGFRGTLRNMRVGARNESGRTAVLALDGMTPATISGQDLRAAVGRTLGWQYVQSTVFELQRTDRGFRLRGHGYGHGVGMCVIGSTKLAIAGESAAQILRRYFPGTELGSVGPRLTAAPPETPRLTAPRVTTVAPPASKAAVLTDLAVSLPEGDEGEHSVVTEIVARERADLTKALGVLAAPVVSVRFHPTTDAFERATGQPWFTLGSIIGTEMQLVPLAVLRDRGVLERTIRHQLVHILADAALTDRAIWVREGAAIHFSEGRNGLGHSDGCPLDAEFVRPMSIGALSDTYARARACFERQLSSGRSWREIR